MCIFLNATFMLIHFLAILTPMLFHKSEADLASQPWNRVSLLKAISVFRPLAPYFQFCTLHFSFSFHPSEKAKRWQDGSVPDTIKSQDKQARPAFEII